MRRAIYTRLKTSSIISDVYNAEDRVMSPKDAGAEPYAVLSEIASQQDRFDLDNAGEYIFRVTVHVPRGQVDLGEQYLQSLTDLFKNNISITDPAGPNTYYYRVRTSDLGAWDLEEIDKTISRSRLLVVPAWG